MTYQSLQLMIPISLKLSQELKLRLLNLAHLHHHPYNSLVRYPWVFLSICGVWVATLAVLFVNIVEPTTIYIYASVTVLILFFLGFARN